MKKIYQLAIIAFTLIGSAIPVRADLADGEMLYGGFDVKQPHDSFGGSDCFTYDIASMIPSEMAGRKITGVMVPFRNTEGLTGMKAWMSKTLSNSNFTPDVVSVDFTPTSGNDFGFTEVRFAEPVTVPEDGIYLGYTFTVSECTTFDQKNPVAISVPIFETDEMLMVHIEGMAWQDYTKSPYGEDYLTSGLLAIMADTPEVSMAEIVPNSGEITRDISAISLPVTVRNLGWNGVNNISYSLNIDGKQYEGDIELTPFDEISARQYGVTSSADIVISDNYAVGKYPYTLDIVKVNGVNNTAASHQEKGRLALYEGMPVRNPVIEEGTSTACTWCPRGFYCMEVTNRLKPEAITIVYHTAQMGYSDPMCSIEEVPWSSGGLPTTKMDRVVDPEDASDRVSGGFIPNWEARRKVFTPAHIKCEARWVDEAHTQLAVDAELNFVEAVNNGNYKLDFALLADGITGKGSNWSQKNGYSGEYTAFTEDEWRKFANGGDYVNGLVFNNVYVLGGTNKLIGMDNTVPANIEANGKVTYTHTFKLDDAKRLVGRNKYDGSLIQDKNKLRVVAILFDGKGEIMNAAKANVPGYDGPLAIEEIDSAEGLIPVAYYDLQGRRVNNPQGGIFIVRYSNGSTVKQVIK